MCSNLDGFFYFNKAIQKKEELFSKSEKKHFLFSIFVNSEWFPMWDKRFYVFSLNHYWLLHLPKKIKWSFCRYLSNKVYFLKNLDSAEFTNFREFVENRSRAWEIHLLSIFLIPRISLVQSELNTCLEAPFILEIKCLLGT